MDLELTCPQCWIMNSILDTYCKECGEPLGSKKDKLRRSRHLAKERILQEREMLD